MQKIYMFKYKTDFVHLVFSASIANLVENAFGVLAFVVMTLRHHIMYFYHFLDLLVTSLYYFHQKVLRR